MLHESDDMKLWKVLLAIGLVALIALSFYGARLVSRGLSTADQPSYLETVVARTARNLAIPRNASLEANPWKATPDVLKDARESFLDRCAVCHGPDGSGQTQDGRNLYPTSAGFAFATNSKSNRWRNPLHHPEWCATDRDAGLGETARRAERRQLEAGSFDPQPAAIEHAKSRQQQASAVNSAHYVGSQSCQKCHAEIYEHWRKTPMANVVRDPARTS